MHARILDIYTRYGEYIKELIPLQVEDEYLKVLSNYLRQGLKAQWHYLFRRACLTPPLPPSPKRSDGGGGIKGGGGKCSHHWAKSPWLRCEAPFGGFRIARQGFGI